MPTDEQTKAPRTMSAEREADLRKRCGTDTQDPLKEIDAERAVSDALLKVLKVITSALDDGGSFDLKDAYAAIALAEGRHAG